MNNEVEKCVVEGDDGLGDPDIKIILLGDSAVGKSKLVERYMMDDYHPRQVTQKEAIEARMYHHYYLLGCV